MCKRFLDIQHIAPIIWSNLTNFLKTTENLVSHHFHCNHNLKEQFLSRKMKSYFIF